MTQLVRSVLNMIDDKERDFKEHNITIILYMIR